MTVADKVWPDQGYWAHTIKAFDSIVDALARQRKALKEVHHDAHAGILEAARVSVDSVRKDLMALQHDMDREVK